jgi:hypothetical protein
MEREVVEVCWTASAIHFTGLSDIVMIFMSLNTLLQLLSWSSGEDEVWGEFCNFFAKFQPEKCD